MEHRVRLKSLRDDELLAGLSKIVQRRNLITAEFLAYLAELDERRLFLDLGFASLFEYCVVALGLCESTAGRHISAARVCRAHPAAFALVESGDLHASALSLIRKHLTAENAAELCALCARQSARKVEELLAARFPRRDVPDAIRRLPAQPALTLDVERCQEPRPNVVLNEALTPIAPSAASVAPLAHAAIVAPPTPAASALPAPPGGSTERGALSRPGAGRIDPLSADRYGVHFTADGEFCSLVERVRGLAGHRLPSGDLMTLIKRGLEAYERELEKERFAVGRRPRRIQSADPGHTSANFEPSNAGRPCTAVPGLEASAKRKRRRPAAVVREVYARDNGQCSYVSPDGRRCSARRCLERDHIEPWANGGDDTPRNLRLRCRAHNQHYARQCFGEVHVTTARNRAQGFRERTEGGEVS